MVRGMARGTMLKCHVKSISLNDLEWLYLKALALELVAEDTTYADPVMAPRATTTQAVRHLIRADELSRATDEKGNPLFKAGLGRFRVLDRASISTALLPAETIASVQIPETLPTPPPAPEATPRNRKARRK
jgi:hypothetical protein